jgi:hypothetical protein
MNQQPIKREPLMDQAYFDQAVAYNIRTINEFEDILKTSTSPPANRARLAYSLFRKRFQFPILLYSQGDSWMEIAKVIPAAIKAWDRYLGMEEHELHNMTESFDDYIMALWLLSLALLFKVDDETFAVLLHCFGEPGQDILLEKLIATRVSNRPNGARVLWPKPYELLLQVINAPVSDRAKHFQKFLETWYSETGKHDAYWHDNHKGKDGGGFFGYWCIEAAGVVSAFGIDDSSFRDVPYYPKDLVRSQ